MSEAEEMRRITAQPFGTYWMPSASRHRPAPSPTRLLRGSSSGKRMVSRRAAAVSS